MQIEKQKPATLRQQLASDYFKQQVALALPKHMTPDRFIRVGLTALMKTPKLLDCTPESVLQCMLACSTLGLEPDGRRAHLIPYGTTCTLIVDYKGIVELAKRSGDVANVFAQIVCENDSFSWETGEVKHQIDFRRERGEMYAAYAIITFKDNTKQCDVMTKGEIDAIRKRSRASGSGPWVTDYNEMAKKTVFRRASKWITLSPEVADAFEKDDGAQFSTAPVDAPLSAKRLFQAPEPQDQVTDIKSDAVPMGGATPLAAAAPAASEPPPPQSAAPVETATETAAQGAKNAILAAGVQIDGVIAIAKSKNLALTADEWKSLDDVPEGVWESFANAPKTLAELVRKFGEKKG
jgi:recombination protein RecT